MRIFKKVILPISLVILLIALDQITKYWAVQNLMGQPPHIIIDGILSFRYHENAGMAFGLMQGGRWFFVALTLPILGFLLYYYNSMPKNPIGNAVRISILGLIGGALGNFVDRLFQGYVVDFIQVTFINFPIFNVADIFVVISTISMGILVFFVKDEDLKFKKGSFKKNG